MSKTINNPVSEGKIQVLDAFQTEVNIALFNSIFAFIVLLQHNKTTGCAGENKRVYNVCSYYNITINFREAKACFYP